MLYDLRVELVWVPAREFDTGADSGDSHEKPVHRLRIAKGFWMAKCEVTNKQYKRFLEDSGYNGSADADSEHLRHFRGQSDMPTGGDYPIVWVSWKNAKAFTDWMTRKIGEQVRLPTEAEWEYACRAGTTGPF